MTDSQRETRLLRRHRRNWRILRLIAPLYLRGVLGFTPEPAPHIDAPVLVLANHNMDLDPALVALSFEKQMYFVASEHIFRWGWISRLMLRLFAPIPLVKGRSDVRAALDIMRTLRSGKNVCVFAEGNRSVDGITAPISPATGLLAKGGADLVTYRLEGGYFTQPRWSASLRRGRMSGRVVGHYTAAQLKEMSRDEINEIIRRDLHEDAYARQAHLPVAFRGKRLAEHLETALYQCPVCGQVGQLHSHGDHLDCACGLHVKYTQTGMLEGIDLCYNTVAKWYAWQLTQIASLISGTGDAPIFTDPAQRLYLIEPCVSATLAAQGGLVMTRELLSIADFVFPLEEIAAMAIVGQMTLTFSLQDGRHFEIKSDSPRSGYKYLNAFEALKNEVQIKNTIAKG